MSQTRDNEWLLDITDSIKYVTSYAASITEDFFSYDRGAQNIIIRECTVIGEAVRRLSPEFIATHPEIPFGEIIAMRNAIIHDYDDIVLPEIWVVVSTDLPKLLKTLQPILDRQKK
jgi:uncharacterized protein with HEPN domain